tara:strand:+ start:564 stop:1064 length:501 start_codon:yes stop_codon:yes gene_type:complete
MSLSFSKNFLTTVEDLVDKIVGEAGDVPSRVHSTNISPESVLPGDVLFFSYRSEKFKDGSHVVMVVGNKRGPYGVFVNGGKRYLSAVKLNKIWSFTANLIVEAYRDKFVMYTSKKTGRKESQASSEKKIDDVMKKAFMSLVGRGNYRTYIMNQSRISNSFEIGKRS